MDKSVVVVHNDLAVDRYDIDRVLAVVKPGLVAVTGHADIWAAVLRDTDLNIDTWAWCTWVAAIAAGTRIWNLNDNWNGTRGDVADVAVLHAREQC